MNFIEKPSIVDTKPSVLAWFACDAVSTGCDLRVTHSCRCDNDRCERIYDDFYLFISISNSSCKTPSLTRRFSERTQIASASNGSHQMRPPAWLSSAPSHWTAASSGWTKSRQISVFFEVFSFRFRNSSFFLEILRPFSPFCWTKMFNFVCNFVISRINSNQFIEISSGRRFFFSRSGRSPSAADLIEMQWAHRHLPVGKLVWCSCSIGWFQIVKRKPSRKKQQSDRECYPLRVNALKLCKLAWWGNDISNWEWTRYDIRLMCRCRRVRGSERRLNFNYFLDGFQRTSSSPCPGNLSIRFAVKQNLWVFYIKFQINWKFVRFVLGNGVVAINASPSTARSRNITDYNDGPTRSRTVPFLFINGPRVSHMLHFLPSTANNHLTGFNKFK